MTKLAVSLIVVIALGAGGYAGYRFAHHRLIAEAEGRCRGLAFSSHGEVDDDDLAPTRRDRLSGRQGQRQTDAAFRRLSRVDVERGAAGVQAVRPAGFGNMV